MPAPDFRCRRRRASLRGAWRRRFETPLASLVFKRIGSLSLSAGIALGAGCKDEGEVASVEAATAGPAATGAKGAAESPEAIEAWMKLDERDFPLLIWSAQIVESDYHAPERFDVSAQLRAATDAIAKELPDFFAESRRADGGVEIEVRVGDARKRFEVPGDLRLREGAEWLERILVYVREQKSLAGDALHDVEYAAINGYLAPLDPHTILLTPEQNADLGIKTQGRFGGVGIRVFEGERRIVVDEVLPDSPARKAGMQAGDVIVKIGTQGTVNMSLAEARDLLRGPEGSLVRVQVRRGAKLVKLEITRGVIQIQSVETARLPGNVAYLRISTFQQDTGAKVGEALGAMAQSAPLEGVLLDLRGNSGGLLTQATALLDHIVGEGELVVVRSASGREAQSARESTRLPAEVPVVALIDENSASAAEIVAGGVAALGRGLVVGRSSFGKGTVQMLKPSQPYGDELALKMTVAEYRVAGDTKIQGQGVQPDLSLLPARLQEIEGVVSLYDTERFERARERSITAKLPSARHEDVAPRHEGGLRLRYLTRSWDLAEGEAPAMRDAEVRLAHEIVQELAGKGTRAAALAALPAVFEKLDAREDAAIAEGMRAFWGDENWWGPRVEVEDAPLRLSAKRLETGPVDAGEVFTVQLEVRNEGELPLDRVHVISQCGQDELDGIEYVFGRLEPGQRKQQTLNLVMMQWHSDLHDELSFDAHVGEPGPVADASASVDFDIRGAARPQLGFDVWVIDDPKATRLPPRPAGDPRFETEPFEIRGNGDGRPQAGEQFLLAFEVHNLGPGVAQATLARVRNLSGKLALLEEGEVELGRIAKGAKARAAIGVTVRPDAPPDAALEFKAMVADAHLRERVDRDLNIELGGSDAQGPWRAAQSEGDAPAIVGPRITFEGLERVVEGETVRLRGSAEHPRAVQDLVIWVQGPGGPLTERKVAYVRAKPAAPKGAEAGDRVGSLRFDESLSLQAGPNRIRVVARDSLGVEGRADAWIFVTKAREK